MKKRILATLIALVIITAVMTVCGIVFGSVGLSPSELLKGLFDGEGAAGVIVRKLRLPRVLAALLTGVALSASGLLLQSATGNDLCSPNVIGMNAGSGFFVMLVLCFFPALYRAVPVFAFAGAVLSVALVLLISGLAVSHREKVTLILAGVAVGAVFNAGISFMSQSYPDVLSSYVMFSTGGFSAVKASELPLPAVIIAVCFCLCMLIAPKLELFCLGDELAANAGVRVKSTRVLALLLASAMTAASVSYAGLIGFVGLMVPHIARRLTGNKMRVLFPVSALTGASLVVFADLLGRTLVAPSEISAGVFLNFLGAPFFIILLLRRNRKNA